MIGQHKLLCPYHLNRCCSSPDIHTNWITDVSERNHIDCSSSSTLAQLHLIILWQGYLKREREWEVEEQWKLRQSLGVTLWQKKKEQGTVDRLATWHGCGCEVGRPVRYESMSRGLAKGLSRKDYMWRVIAESGAVAADTDRLSVSPALGGGTHTQRLSC